MATYYFGLNVNRNFAEISDPEESLENLNLSIRDLDKIRGVTDAGVTKTDLQTLSGLDFDAEKVTTALSSETYRYPRLTTNVYDKYSYVDSNIDVSGSIAASSFKYKFVDFNEPNPALQVKTADVSTSRVSSWSTFVTDPISPEKSAIFYGGNVSVEGPVELSKLIINSPITKREFASEIPTHRVLANVNGTSVYLYAMKGIPLSFDGFFRTGTNQQIRAKVNRINNPSGQPINPSWVIRDTTQPSTFANTIYRNISTNDGVSGINYSSTTARNRTIELYYPPDNITELSLSRLNILNIPKVVLPNLTALDLSYNDLREFPDLSAYTKIASLNLSHNNLIRAADQNLRTLSANVVSRIPANVEILTLGNVFGGNITGNLASLSKLRILDLSSISNDNRLYTGVTPAVNSAVIQEYYMNVNRFTSISSTVLNSNVKVFSIHNNPVNQQNIAFTSPELLKLIIYNNNGEINLIDVNNKQKLTDYIFQETRVASAGNNVRTIFNGCSALKTISLYNAPVTGNFPELSGCNSLEVLNMIYTNVQGFDTVNNFAFANNTASPFTSCRSTLQQLYVASGRFGGVIHPDTFKGMFRLNRLMIFSNKGVSGTINNAMFSDCVALEVAWFIDTSLTGSIPVFSNSPRLYYLWATGNGFTGSVPNIARPNFQYMYLYNNALSQFSKLDSTGLIIMHLSGNQLTNIPDLSNLVNLQEIYLNGNSITEYFTGSFVNMPRLRILNLNNNNLSQGRIDQIILDLYQNYLRSNRGGVTVNLAGGANSPPSRSSGELILALNAAGWTITTE